MVDLGASNTAVGHRRWLLYPPQTTMGVGATSEAHALFVQDKATWATGRRGGWISWPPPGFVIARHVYPRFSLSRARARFRDATVRVTVDGEPVRTRVVSRFLYYGDPAIVFEPDLDEVFGSDPTSDHVIRVTVRGIWLGGRSVTRTWRTVAFVPSDAESSVGARSGGK